MATIRQKGPSQWHVQVRKRGFPTQTRTFRTKKDAQNWSREVETEMYRGRFQDQRPNRGITFGALIQHYMREVTNHRPGTDSRVSEHYRLLTALVKREAHLTRNRCYQLLCSAI